MCSNLYALFYVLGGVGVGVGFTIVVHKVHNHNREKKNAKS